MNKWWLLACKKEMTKMWIDDVFTPVTIVKILPQEIIRYKNQEKDWYVCAVIGSEKKEFKKDKWQKISYKQISEFEVNDEFIKNHETGEKLDSWILEWIKELDIVWQSKWKWYQWVMKIFHVKWWPKTHWSKFHRHIGSLGNRKPRRTMKWHPHAKHLGNKRVTLKDIKLLDIIKRENEQMAVLKWSIPWPYNWILKLLIK